MQEVRTTPAKYIFLDVVGFTNNRSVEAQSEIVGILNGLVNDCLKEQNVSNRKRILLPTGDGICIALLNIESPYDIHVQIALSILRKLHQHNTNTEVEDSRKFNVRIGINANTDNLVTDINRRLNIAGAGINVAQRVMDKADGGQILVSQTVYEQLRHREQYMQSFADYQAETKHGERVNVHQLRVHGYEGLNLNTPSAFDENKSVRKLCDLAAHYFINAIMHRASLVESRHIQYQDAGIVLLYFMALDTLEWTTSTEVDEPHFAAHRQGEASFSEQLDYYNGQDFWVRAKLARLIINRYLANFYWCFERRVSGTTDYRFVKAEGREKLRTDWPELWAEWELDKYASK